MKAIIMAGGEGSRLRPLTCDCPKPMVPLMDRPVMSYALELLKRHGVKEAAVTLHYLPDRVKEYFGDGSERGVKLCYYVEQEPLGTAGSVAQAKDFLTETFVVLSGDGVTDCDLSEALRFHRDRRAAVTIVLKRVENPLEYGVVVADEHGRVKKFVEKPGWGEVVSDAVNTGIYIMESQVLERIPDGVPFDFAKDLFPKLLKEGEAVYACVTEGYWCDVGDISAYLRVHADAMDGKINLPMPCRTGGVVRMEGARIDQGAVLEAPCFIASGAVIGKGARIGAYSVISEGCIVGERAGVKRSVLWRNACMKSEAQARGCVLTEKACMGEGSSAFEESVLGCGARLGQGSMLMPGVKVWPGKCVDDRIRLDANLVWGAAQRPCFHEGRLMLGTPSQAARTAQAYAAAVRPKNVLVGRAASSVALSCALAVQSGLMAQGIQILDAGSVSLPQLRVMNERLHTGGAVYVDGEAMRPLDENGVELRSACRRKIEGLLLRQDFERAFAAVTKLPVNAGRGDLMYTGYLLEHSDEEALSEGGVCAAVWAASEGLLSAAECVLEKAGCVVRVEWEDELMELSNGEIGIWLTEDGERMHLADEDGGLSESENMLIRVWTLLEQGEKNIILPVGATRSAEALAALYRARIERVKGERAHWMQALMEESRHQLMVHFDGLYAALQCIGALKRKGMTLTQWKRSMPRMNRRTSLVSMEWKDKGRILAALLAEEGDADMTDGMSVCKDGAWVWIAPSEELAQCRIVTEAERVEAAQELCDFYEEKIRKLTAQKKKADSQ